MEKIIQKAVKGGYLYPITKVRFNDKNKSANFTYVDHEWDGKTTETTILKYKEIVCAPMFWQSLFRNKTEALIPRQKFFSILFGDEGGNEGWNEAVKYLEDLIN